MDTQKIIQLTLITLSIFSFPLFYFTFDNGRTRKYAIFWIKMEVKFDKIVKERIKESEGKTKYKRITKDGVETIFVKNTHQKA